VVVSVVDVVVTVCTEVVVTAVVVIADVVVSVCTEAGVTTVVVVDSVVGAFVVDDLVDVLPPLGLLKMLGTKEINIIA